MLTLGAADFALIRESLREGDEVRVEKGQTDFYAAGLAILSV